jgi:hypothetical protein
VVRKRTTVGMPGRVTLGPAVRLQIAAIRRCYSGFAVQRFINQVSTSASIREVRRWAQG